ncbi:SMP-30/gluconolactonase/LRE family protein [Bordetella sp. LUAb4]|uniref:SMP-30/gluconolactonase/LRE family protein n=1 Tax=Bordetella sp. LUAb4 TaxID=2843195 RepID=UPI001E3776A5|nr:major royal jelly family protein [Bordetella sp. LUAb4]
MRIARNLTRAAGIAAASLALMIVQGCATKPESQDPLVPVFQGQRVWNGVTTTSEGRVFVSYSQADGPGTQVAELDAQGQPFPFPDANWNIPLPSVAGPIGNGYVHVNALRVGPDGKLWIVDAGAPGIGKAAVKGGARLFQFDPQTRSLLRVYDLAPVVNPYSYMDDVRFNGPFAYLTDAGSPGLVVLDMRTGVARRVLDSHPSVMASRPLQAEGRTLKDAKGQPLYIHADQLEVSPDGQWLYYQPASGPMARIATRWLNDATVSPKDVESHVELKWANTPTTGGTAIDSQGNIYVSDTDKQRILRISPEGKQSVVIEDQRLVWADAMWIDRAGYLWIPASQQSRTPDFNGGKMEVRNPVVIYKLQIHAQPSPLDQP